MVEPTVQENKVEDPKRFRAVALRQIGQIRKLKETKKNYSEMKKGILVGDKKFARATEDGKEFVQAIKDARNLVTKLEEYASLIEKNKEANKELREIQISLTGNLQNFTRLTGVNYIEDENGKELKIKHTVELKSGQIRLI